VISAPDDTPSDTKKHPSPPDPETWATDLAQPDAVERAIADALLRASRAEAWDTVRALTDELRARRAARAGVVDLEAERSRRERGGR